MQRPVATAMSQEAILEKVSSIVAEQLSLVMALEEAFDIEIPDEAAEGITTVGDAVKYIQDKQA